MTPRYAVHIGRVGALAVSLGIGLAVAHSATGVAHAEGDSDSGSSASPSDSASSGSGTESSASSAGPRKVSNSPTRRDAVSEHKSDADSSGSTTGSSASEDAASDTVRSAKSRDKGNSTPDGAGSVADQQVADTEVADPPAEVETAPANNDAPSPSEDAVQTATVAPTARTAASPVAEPVADQTMQVNLVGAVVSNVIAPLVDPTVPVTSPATDLFLAYVRRIITHTFFNKTPVVNSVTTTQVLGQVIVDIDATDPNGDPLTYEIVQPDNGLVFQIPLTTTFVYTPTELVLGDPLPVTFSVIVHDDSEHLTGVLGSIQLLLHGLARAFGLAKPDNFTQVVSFNVAPVVQVNPSLVALPGLLPFVTGGNPIKVLSTANIVDPDSDTMKSARLSISVGSSVGDVLEYIQPQGISITGGMEGDTLVLSGVASKADYETALKAVTFKTTSASILPRTVSVDLVDAQGVHSLLPALVPVLVIPLVVKTPPGLIPVPGLLPFIVGGSPTKVLTAAGIADLDSPSLKSAKIWVSLGQQTGDALGYTDPQGVTLTPTWENAYTLVLSGVASQADYEAALEAVTFSTTSTSLLPRTVSIELTDPDDLKNLVPATVPVVVLPALPVELPLTVVAVPNSLALIHTVGKPPIKLMSSVAIANADNDQLKAAVVVIGAGRLAGDKLTYTGPAGPINVVQTNDYTLTFTGVGSTAQYEAALASVSFSSTQAGLVRAVTISVTEGDGDTNPVPGLVSVSSIPALRPTIVTVGLAGLSFPSVGQTVKPITLATIVDLDSDVLTGASVKITGGLVAGDTLGFAGIAGNAVSVESWNGTTGELKLTGTASKAAYKAALEAVTFKATQFGASGIFAPLFLNRTLQVNVTDDSSLNALVPGAVTVQVNRL